MLDPSQVTSRAVYQHDQTFFALAVDSVTRRAYAGSSDYSVHVFDLKAEKQEALARWTRHENYVSALLLVERPAGNLVVSAGFDRQLIWWDAATGEVRRTIAAHDKWVRHLVLAPGGAWLASAGDDMLVKMWDVESGQLIRAFEGHAARTPQGHVTALYALAVSPDGSYLASGDRIGEVRIWEAATGTLAQVFQVPTLYTYDPVQRKRSIGGVRSLAFSPDGSRLAAGGIGQIENVNGLQGPLHVELWDWRQPKRLAVLAADGHQAMINDLAFHPAEPWLIGGGGGGGNGVLVFWKTDALPAPPEAEPGKDPPPLGGQKVGLEGHIHRLRLDPAGSELCAAGFRKLEVWGLAG